VLEECFAIATKESLMPPSYTKPQLEGAKRLLVALAEKASDMRPGFRLVIGDEIRESAYVLGDKDKTSGRHYLALTHEGLLYTRLAYKHCGFLGLRSQFVGEKGTKIDESRYEEMIDIFGLGPRGLTATLNELGDPYKQGEEQS
jgi:hypothetical protein